MSQLMLIGNPRRRRARKAGARRKGRSAAQRAATARMLAANRSRRGLRSNPRKRRSKRRASPVASAPRRAARRSSPRRARRSGRSRSLFGGLRARSGGAVSMLKSGAIGGVGAVANDVLFGFAGKVLPAGWMSPVNADGSTNWMYFAAKAGVAVALGTYGGKVLPSGIAAKMADGALTVLSYQILRGMVPSGLTLGYYNPVPTMQPRRLGAYVQQSLGAYTKTSTPEMTRATGESVQRMLRSVR